MMGSTHSQSGATAFAAYTSVVHLAGHAMPWQVAAAGTIACSGAALIPDSDHPQATIAHSFGPASRTLTRYVHEVSGGHRCGTHTIAFTAGFFGATWFGVHELGVYLALPLLFVLAVFAVHALHLVHHATYAAAGAVCVAAFFLMHGVHGDYTWLPTAVGLGIAVHLLGDCLTHEGCPLLWPRRTYYRIPLIARTGNKVEHYLFGPLFSLGTLALFVFAR